MNWDAIGAVGEVVGALTVVLTLVYLAIQIKQNTLAVDQSAQQSLVSEIGSITDALFTNQQTAEVWVGGLESWSSLNRAEQAQFGAGMHHAARLYEQGYLSFRAGTLDPQIWEGMEAAVTEVFSLPGPQEWWSLRRHWFSEAFRELIDKSKVEAAKAVDLYR